MKRDANEPAFLETLQKGSERVEFGFRNSIVKHEEFFGINHF
jgi:hypothetical protein